MNGDVIINELFSSIKTIAKKEIENSGLTRTAIGNIVNSKKDSDGAYTIEIEGHRTKGFPLYPRAYEDGEIIIVLVSSSGIRGRNFILGVASSIYGGKIVDRSDPIISLKTELNIQAGQIEAIVEQITNIGDLGLSDGKNLVLNSGFLKGLEGIYLETPDQEGVVVVEEPGIGKYLAGRYTVLGFPIDYNNVSIGSKMNLSLMIKGKYPSSIGEIKIGTVDGMDFQLYTGEIIVSDQWQRLNWDFTTTSLLEKMYVLIGSAGEEIYATNIMLVNSPNPLEWLPNPEDLETSIEQIRTEVAGITITPDQIVSTVINSTSFTEILGEKANADDLNAYLTSEEYASLSQAEKDRIDKIIEDLELSLGEYVTSAELVQTAEDITAKFSVAGGINLLKNSIGFAGTDFWTEEITGIKTVQTNELEQLGFGSGWFSEVGKIAKIKQEIVISSEQSFTISAYINKFSSSGGKVRIYAMKGTALLAEISTLDLTGGFVYFYKTFTTNPIVQYSRVFFAETTEPITVYIEFDADVQATVTGLMINIGEVPLQWSMARGEVYNTNIKMDLSGIKVAKIEEEKEVKYTVMTPDKFAGYYDVNKDGVIDSSSGSPDEVFRMDEDEFVMKKSTIREEINMGAIKVLKIDTDTSSGWAFIGNV